MSLYIVTISLLHYRCDVTIKPVSDYLAQAPIEVIYLFADDAITCEGFIEPEPNFARGMSYIIYVVKTNTTVRLTCSDRAHGIVYFGYWLGTVVKYCTRNGL